MPSKIKAQMIKFLYYGFFHFAILSIFSYREYTNDPYLYPFFTSLVQNNGLHLLHTLFLILLIYLISKCTITSFLGSIRPDEISSLNDCCFMFLTDILLVITIFSEDLTIKNLIIFSVLLSLKCINWIVIERIKVQQDKKVISIIGIVLILSGTLSYCSLFYALEKPSLFILFAYEFGILSLFCLRNICYIIIQKKDLLFKEPNEERKTIETFINDIVFLGAKLGCVISFFIFTAMNFRLPFNLFREAVSTTRLFYKKVNGLMMYIQISKMLDKLEDYTPVGDNNCPICFCEMEVGKKIDCGHVFHKHCLKKCIETSEVCPICRRDLFRKEETVTFVSGNEVITGVPITYTD